MQQVKYVITGATGELGSRVFRNLLKLVPASAIIVSLYNPYGVTQEIKQSGVEIRRGDYSQPSTLDTAFAGANKLLLVSHPSFTDEYRVGLHKAAIDAAKRAGIEHVYYTSLGFADDSVAALMAGHLGTEKALKESGLTYTIIRESIYAEAWPAYFAWHPGRGNGIKIPYGDGGIAYACKDDLGEGTAKLMVADTHKNETVRLTGLKAVTLADIGTQISSLLQLDAPLKVNVIPAQEYIGWNPNLRKWATTYEAMARGEMEVVEPVLRELLGRDPKPFEETLKEALGL